MATSNSAIFVVKLLGKQKLTNVYIIVIIKNKTNEFLFSFNCNALYQMLGELLEPHNAFIVC